MKNEIRELSIHELTAVAGGDDCFNIPLYWDGMLFPIADPKAPHPMPIPDYGFFIDPGLAWGPTLPQPVVPKKPGGP